MADAVEIDIAYVAPVTLVPRRARTEKTLRAAGTVRVEVPVVTGKDAPLAIRGTGRHPFERRLHAGRLVAPMEGRAGRLAGGGGADWLRNTLSDSNRVVGTLFGRDRRGPWETPRLGVPLPAFERIVEDGREAVEARVRRAAAGLVLVDGIAHMPMPEPVYLVDRMRRMSIDPTVYGETRWNDRAPYAFGFRIDRRDAFEEFVRASVRTGGYEFHRGAGEIPKVELDVCEASLLEFREDMHNAWWAAVSAIVAGGESLAGMSAPMAMRLAELVEMRDGLMAGNVDPQAVDAHIAALSAMRGGDAGRMVLLKNTILLGREAIAASVPTYVPGDAPPLSEEDMEAFEGMGAFGP